MNNRLVTKFLWFPLKPAFGSIRWLTTATVEEVNISAHDETRDDIWQPYRWIDSIETISNNSEPTAAVETVRPLVTKICELIRSRGVRQYNHPDDGGIIIPGLAQYTVVNTDNSIIITLNSMYDIIIVVKINSIDVADMGLNDQESDIIKQTCCRAILIYKNILEKQKHVQAETQIADHINKIR